MTKVIGMMLLLVGMQVAAIASAPAPEVDPGTGTSALALLGGVALIVRARRSRKG